MSVCQGLAANASGGVVDALRAIDCLSAETTSRAFDRLFGAHGTLVPALTILLTLYIAVFAIGLLTGRSRLSVAALTPRMLALGLALTFATSWLAYTSVIWNLAVGAPDEIAQVINGGQGSATELFASKIDIVFEAIVQVADDAGGQAPQPDQAQQGQAQPQTQGQQGQIQAASVFSPPGLMWLAAVLLLLGTVGVLATARIILAVLLALGPVFIVLMLFKGTRGLFVGWLRALVLSALTPLITVLAGGLMLELAVPVVAALQAPMGVDGRAAMALFLIAAVYLAVMAMALRTASTMVSAWQVFGLATPGEPARADAFAAPATMLPATLAGTPYSAAPAVLAGRGAAAAIAGTASTTGGGASVSPVEARGGRTVVTAGGEHWRAPQIAPLRRAHGVGSRFRAPTPIRTAQK